MKKMKIILGGSLLAMTLCMSVPASVYAADTDTTAENEEMSWVFDDCGILSEDEITELNGELSDIYDTYGYDAVLWISPDVGEDEDYRQYAAEFMQDNEIGYGDTHEGMCIFHQPGVRNITIVFRGETQNDFSTKIQDKMLDKCKTYLKADDPFGGYQSLIHDLTAGLDRIAEGQKIRPMDISEDSAAGRFLTDLLMAFVIMIIPTGVLTWYQVRKMKTRVQQADASAYTADGGLELSEKHDIFLYETVSQTAKPKNDDNDSGSFSSGGESFSGSSSNY
ncbi:TPM domain-containing protein [Blautia sp. MSJ-19]|uniref:TPM domain-containing protein n=1 Tax=Blautia sp. MSJ-19 TaxID=2841517 RepID=UPI001C0EAD08|nr:TPM domain-containing protein [Blautia sp. MSJ-19]MBU5482368.1 TPM domain-containing protein [Blautia sp. MSJ-19]